MRDLNHDFKELCRHNRDGSYATQADRAHILDLVANQLHEMGVAVARRQLDEAQAIATALQPHRLGIDRDRVAEVEPGRGVKLAGARLDAERLEFCRQPLRAPEPTRDRAAVDALVERGRSDRTFHAPVAD